MPKDLCSSFRMIMVGESDGKNAKEAVTSRLCSSGSFLQCLLGRRELLCEENDWVKLCFELKLNHLVLVKMNVRGNRSVHTKLLWNVCFLEGR